MTEFMLACNRGDIKMVNRLIERGINPAVGSNRAIVTAACDGRLAVVDRLLQDERVDPSANDNYAVRMAAYNGHLAVIDRLLQDKRVDPSADDNYTVQLAARSGELAIVDRLLEDSRVDFAVALRYTPLKDRRRFERRERFIDICIALQSFNLPAWVTVKILKACEPRSTLKLHQKWKLACAVKHFHDKE